MGTDKCDRLNLGLLRKFDSSCSVLGLNHNPLVHKSHSHKTRLREQFVVKFVKDASSSPSLLIFLERKITIVKREEMQKGFFNHAKMVHKNVII